MVPKNTIYVNILWTINTILRKHWFYPCKFTIKKFKPDTNILNLKKSCVKMCYSNCIKNPLLNGYPLISKRYIFR